MASRRPSCAAAARRAADRSATVSRTAGPVAARGRSVSLRIPHACERNKESPRDFGCRRHSPPPQPARSLRSAHGMPRGFKCSVGTRAELADSRFVHALRLRTGALRRGILWAPPDAGAVWNAKGIQVFRWYTCRTRRLTLRPRAAPEGRRAPEERHSLGTPGCRRRMGCQGDSSVPLVHVRNSQTRASSTCCA